MRRFDQPPTEIEGLADLLEPRDVRYGPRSRAHDIAFADTVFMGPRLDDEAPPPSGPVIVNDPERGSQWMTPFAFPLPAAIERPSLAARIRRAWRAARDELREQWGATSDVVGDERMRRPRTTTARAIVAARRVRALWSFWHWEGVDFARAGIIGLGVFVLAATVGTAVLDVPELGSVTRPMTPTSEVRARHTVDEHTARAFVVRKKKSIR